MEVEGPATLVTPTPAAAAPGLYDATLRRSIADRSLHDETIFECVLSIPHTQYQVRRRSIYYPGRLVLFGLFLISLLFFVALQTLWSLSIWLLFLLSKHHQL